ncbi:thioester reductase domain-containing protein [Duganella callida]|uniref:NAD-dependent epimerase/dehydratase family protein n=1 Tax=Duganella callida TaxID=2561932 RepID=A0A4Y9S7J6_9BURK|nr:thioester reductase domain-containing protein [Duganella callida]TFW17243.1 NAD-dependent epimerase/dehydratase family protein [Duganella callida]
MRRVSPEAPLRSITACLEGRAAREPEQLLFRFLRADGNGAEHYTCRAFLARSRAIAAGLIRTLGPARGQRVLLAYPPGLEMVLAFFACARLGVIPVPVMSPGAGNFSGAMHKLDVIAADCGACAVLSTAALCEFVAARDWPQPQPRWLATDGMTDPADAPPDHPHPVLFLQYTSGSTGDPRGVVVSHDNVIANAFATIDHVPVGVSWLPQYHDMGLIGYYLFPVVCGGATHGMAPADFLRRPALWLQTISQVRATYASAPNFGFDYCLRDGKISADEMRGVDLGSLRVLMNAAEPVRPATRERFIERFARHGLRDDACVAAYGLAENTLAATHYGRHTLALGQDSFQRGIVRLAAQGDAVPVRLASCGAPLPGVALRIVAAERGVALAEDEIGEIWLAGSSTAAGYWGRERSGGEAFGNRLDGSAHAWLRTGDLGFLHDGELYVCGRSKDLIIVRGVNHYPQDIEAAVEAACPALRSGGVAAFQGRDDALVVLAESRRAAPPDIDAMARALQMRCQVTPDAIVLAAPGMIARTTSGKPARSLTRQRYLAGQLTVYAVHHPPADGLLAHLRAALAGGGAGDASLADLGLDSLMLTELALDLERMLHRRGGAQLAEVIDLPLLQRLTLAQLGQLLRQLDGGGAAAAIAADLRQLRAGFDTDISLRMRADAQWRPPRAAAPRLPGAAPASATPADGSPPASRPGGLLSSEPSDVLLTGATGFFGPYLLASLLRLTPHTYHLLVRADDQAHAVRRVRQALHDAALLTPSMATLLAQRTRMVCGDLARPGLGLAAGQWDSLAGRTGAVIHNAAAVNYVANYEALRPHNVEGTRTLLELAHTGRRKQFHLISTTFIFGWTTQALLSETDNNDAMANLDFGYAQTKWVAEQLVLAARAGGLDARIYRPSLISTSTTGAGDRDDVAVRLLAFMINHGVAVDAANQLSILAADVAADNLAAIIGAGGEGGAAMHLTVDDYYNMADLTRLITRDYGYRFTYYDIPGFIAEMNRRCTRADPLYPLLDFFNRSATKIAAMQLKRYSNQRYRAARRRSGQSRAAPALADTVSFLIAYLRAERMII